MRERGDDAERKSWENKVNGFEDKEKKRSEKERKALQVLRGNFFFFF